MRLRITNAYGGYPAAAGDAFPENTALRVGSVYVGRRSGTHRGGRARHADAGHVRRQADRAHLARQRRRQRPGRLPVTDGDNLAISIYVPGTTPNASYHSGAQADALHDAGQRRRPRRAGRDATGFTSNTTSWWFLDAVSVEASDQIGAVVALGDSITDGANSTINTNHRWPDYLAARLNAVNNPVGVRGVVNEGISGNSVLKDYNCCGGNPSGLSRLDRDVISHDGVSTVIVALGINDLGNYADDVVQRRRHHRRHAPDRRQAPPRRAEGDLGDADAVRGHDAGRLLQPRQGRQAAADQRFIRTTPYFDGVVDFEKALADPANPLRMLPAYDSGDHLHPNDAGNAALANAVTWLDDPSLPISRRQTTTSARAVPATLALTLGDAADVRRVRPGRGAGVHGARRPRP